MTTQDLDVEETAEEREEPVSSANEPSTSPDSATMNCSPRRPTRSSSVRIGRLSDLRARPSRPPAARTRRPPSHRLERGLELLTRSAFPASLAAQGSLRDRARRDPDGPTPATLVSTRRFASRPRASSDSLRKAIEPRSSNPTARTLSRVGEGDPRAEHTARRRAIEKRRDLIADELKDSRRARRPRRRSRGPETHQRAIQEKGWTMSINIEESTVRRSQRRGALPARFGHPASSSQKSLGPMIARAARSQMRPELRHLGDREERKAVSSRPSKKHRRAS